MCLGLKRWRLKVCGGVLHSPSVVYELGLASPAASRGIESCLILLQVAGRVWWDPVKTGQRQKPKPYTTGGPYPNSGTALNPKLQSKP